MKKNGILGRFFLLLCFLFLYAPILVLVVFSFNASKSKAVWAGFTLDWYVELFHNDMILNALWGHAGRLRPGRIPFHHYGHRRSHWIPKSEAQVPQRLHDHQ